MFQSLAEMGAKNLLGGKMQPMHEAKKSQPSVS
jgi:hypothetical protein